MRMSMTSNEVILQAIEQKNGKLAEEAVKSHLQPVGDRLVKSIQDENN